MENTLEAIKEEVPQVLDYSKKIVVTRDNIDQINKWVRETILETKKRIEIFFEPEIKKAHELHKSLTTKRAQFLAPLIEAESIIRNKISDYLAQERRRIEEEERKLREQAEKEAEKERQKIIAQAAKAEKRGDTERAEGLFNKAETVQPVCVSVIPKSVEGLGQREEWYFEIVSENLIPREYLIVNEKILTSIAKSTKGTLKIPGVVFKKKITPIFGK